MGTANTYLKASDLKKSFDSKWINEKFNSIKKNQAVGRWSTAVGKYSCTPSTLNEFARILKENGFRVDYGVNSHGVKTIIVTW